MSVFCSGIQTHKQINYLDYIESTGSQFIDTGVLAKSSLTIVVDVMPLEEVGYSLIGYYNSQTDSFRLFNYQSTAYLDFGDGSTGRIYGGSFPANVRANLEFANRYVKNLSTGENIVSGSSVASFEKTTNIFINGNQNYAKARWYSCKIYDDGVLLRDYQPCLDDNGVACLYDKVTREYVYSDGSKNFYAPGEGPSVAINTVWTYTSATTFTVPETGSYQLEMHGGGGGGGRGGMGSNDDGETTYYCYGGAGGGSGILVTAHLTKGDSYKITIGAGGVGGTDVSSWGDWKGGSGGTGGITKFGDAYSVAGGFGGSGGSYGNTGAAGGAAGNIASGKYGHYQKTSQTYGNGGDGSYGSHSDGSAGSAGAVIITFLG